MTKKAINKGKILTFIMRDLLLYVLMNYCLKDFVIRNQIGFGLLEEEVRLIPLLTEHPTDNLAKIITLKRVIRLISLKYHQERRNVIRYTEYIQLKNQLHYLNILSKHIQTKEELYWIIVWVAVLLVLLA